MLISLLITLIVLAIVFYIITLVLGLFPISPTLKNIIYAILGLIFLLILLNSIGLGTGTFGGWL